MTDIQITTTSSGRIALTCPYSADLVASAKEIGGRWDGSHRQWTFDSRDEDRVRELARRIFGSDGSPADQADLVTVQWDISNQGTSRGDSEISLAGRVVASRRERDSEVRLGQNVILISGGFSGSGGSTKYPALAPLEGTVIEVRDIPRAAATGVFGLTIVGSTVDIGALRARREQLLAELAELEQTIAEHGASS